MGWALALSGGGTKGSAHAGAMLALQEAGLTPSLIGGTSAGAIVSGLYASGVTTQGLIDIMRYMQGKGNRWLDPDFLGILGAGLSLIRGKPLRLGGLLKGDRLEDYFAQETHGRLLREACLPVVLTAVDINRAQLVLFSSQDITGLPENQRVLTHPAIYEGIRASIAIPAVFAPFMAEGMRLVDGGVWESMPVEALYAMGASHVIAINVGYGGEQTPKVDDLFEIASQSISLMGFELAVCRSRKADYRLDVPMEGIGVFSFEKMEEGLQRGYDAMKKALPEIRRALRRSSQPAAQRRLRATEQRGRTAAG